MFNETKPILGITLGDPSGVGPEIIVKALSNAHIYQLCNPLVIGDAAILSDTVSWLKSELKINKVSNSKQSFYQFGTVDVFDMGIPLSEDFQIGKVSKSGGELAFQAVKTAILMAMAGEMDGTVTAPINKEAINLAGHHFAGHTEIYAEFTGTKEYCMMLAHEDFRVAHVSTHVSLRTACDRATKARVISVIHLVNEALMKLGIQQPRIAVAGLNPHAGEGGMFGREEIDEIIPAIEKVQSEGILAEGPFPPDTIFPKLKGKFYDIVICMYHDQGHIPTKLIGFNYDIENQRWSSVAGINITLGLPIIRVSVDHGTAFDIAGHGIANEKSMIDAITYAAHLANTKS